MVVVEQNHIPSHVTHCSLTLTPSASSQLRILSTVCWWPTLHTPRQTHLVSAGRLSKLKPTMTHMSLLPHLMSAWTLFTSSLSL